jgi:hypothetical protein
VVELVGDLLRARRVLGEHELEPRVGAVQAARRVDARRQPVSPGALASTPSGSTFATRMSARRPGLRVAPSA